jgi:hypothetical protein
MGACSICKLTSTRGMGDMFDYRFDDLSDITVLAKHVLSMWIMLGVLVLALLQYEPSQKTWRQP